VRRVFNKQDILCFPSYSQGICMSLSIIAVQLRLVEQPVVHSAEHKFLRRWPEERPGESPHGENNLAVYFLVVTKVYRRSAETQLLIAEALIVHETDFAPRTLHEIHARAHRVVVYNLRPGTTIIAI